MAKAKQTAPSPDARAVLSEEHRRIVAYGIATMHRFSPEPAFKHGKPQYKGSNTIEAIAHAKSKRRE